MRKAALWTTDWIGWLLIEIADALYPGAALTGWRVACGDVIYDAGNWFYRAFDEVQP